MLRPGIVTEAVVMSVNRDSPGVGAAPGSDGTAVALHAGHIRRKLALAAFGTPLLATVFFFCTYGAAALSPDAPSGDTGFTWMPLLYFLVAVPLWLLVALCAVPGLIWPPPRRVGVLSVLLVAVGCCAVVVGLFGLFPSWGSSDGFPTTFLSVGAAVVGATCCLALPVLLIRTSMREGLVTGKAFLLFVLASVIVGTAVGTVDHFRAQQDAEQARQEAQAEWDQYEPRPCSARALSAVRGFEKLVPWKRDVVEGQVPEAVNGVCLGTGLVVTAPYSTVQPRIEELLIKAGFSQDVQMEILTPGEEATVSGRDGQGRALRIDVADFSGPDEIATTIDVQIDDP